MAEISARLIRLMACACIASLCLSGTAAYASSYRVIYEFAAVGDGVKPAAGLVKDGEGRLYGTTVFSSGGGPGTNNTGTVFRLTRPAAGIGTWTEEILHSFSFSGVADGSYPEGPVVLGPSGELYGTASGGGNRQLGTIYRLGNVPGWPLTVLHSFRGSPDGQYPSTGLVFGVNGLLYGDTGYSLDGDGMAFSVSPSGDGTDYSMIYKFANGSGGKGPFQLVATKTGKIYGAAEVGGTFNAGTAFSLSLDSKGRWRQRTLYNFGSPGDIRYPGGPLLIGQGILEGSLFGCDAGGAHTRGAVYRLDPPLQAQTLWTETILYNFGDQPDDPAVFDYAHCGLTQDSHGKLFGTTPFGGTHGLGALFELDPPTADSATWSEHMLHSFGGEGTLGSKGATPNFPPLRMGGVFYGTTVTTDATGGPGVVWEFTP